jgi:hypothetical protein
MKKSRMIRTERYGLLSYFWTTFLKNDISMHTSSFRDASTENITLVYDELIKLYISNTFPVESIIVFLELSIENS